MKRASPLLSNSMMKKYFFILVLVLFGCRMLPAANVIKEAKTAIKNGNNLENAEKKLLETATNPQTKHGDKAECYYMAGLINRKINAIENEKLYLKQNYDTAKFFNSIYTMFVRFQQCDSVEMQPDAKGHIKFKYRRKVHDILLTYRDNLLNGGKFFLRKNNYGQAYPFFDMYIACASAPMFEKEFFLQSDTLMTRAAYWATLAAYSNKQAAQTLKHADLALKLDMHRKYIQEYKAKSHFALQDTARWLADLKEGLINYPEHTYFFVNLMDYFNEAKRYEEGIHFADTMIRYNPQSSLFWYAKSAVLMNMRRYEECIAVSDSVLKRDTAYVDAYYNKGISYCNMALMRAEKLNPKVGQAQYRKDREAVAALYRKALPPMRMVRKLAPEDTARWANPLYRIYLNLNMGKEFDEIDKILKAQK